MTLSDLQASLLHFYCATHCTQVRRQLSHKAT